MVRREADGFRAVSSYLDGVSANNPDEGTVQQEGNARAGRARAAPGGRPMLTNLANLFRLVLVVAVLGFVIAPGALAQRAGAAQRGGGPPAGTAAPARLGAPGRGPGGGRRRSRATTRPNRTSPAATRWPGSSGSPWRLPSWSSWSGWRCESATCSTRPTRSRTDCSPRTATGPNSGGG